MPDRANKLAVVIPTLGRPELRRMLETLATQTRLADEVIIIGEDEEGRNVADGLPQLNSEFLAMKRGSTSAKRNLGAKVAAPDMTLIAFLDDDLVMEPNAFEVMVAFWDQAGANVGAASFNLRNRTPFFAPWLKSRRLTAWLGLYSTQPGAVLRSGIQTRIDPLAETTYVEWLAAGAAVFRRDVLNEFAFDEFFEGYGYLEDLDLTYRVGKKFRLAVVADAGFYNYPSPVGRVHPYLFGKKEVINRLYFVRKNRELSVLRCLLALATIFFMNLGTGILAGERGRLARACGNVVGLFAALFIGSKPALRRSRA